METAETEASTPAPLKIKGCGTPPYFCASIPVTRNSARQGQHAGLKTAATRAQRAEVRGHNLLGDGRCVRFRGGSRGWSRLGIRRRGIGGQVEIVADGFAPGIGAEGVDVFVLGEVQGLHEGLAEIREGGGGFGL